MAFLMFLRSYDFEGSFGIEAPQGEKKISKSIGIYQSTFTQA